jgi:hypothetical protein
VPKFPFDSETIVGEDVMKTTTSLVSTVSAAGRRFDLRGESLWLAGGLKATASEALTTDAVVVVQ